MLPWRARVAEVILTTQAVWPPSIWDSGEASHVPPPLLKQLKPGGRIVIPLGASFMTQYLMLVEKKLDGSVSSRQIDPVRFVPLTGGH